MQLAEVVPWGRSFAEYRQMFSLTDEELKKTILGCADGPASFNAELTLGGGQVVSVDPLYRFSPEQIGLRIEATSALVLEQVRQSSEQFVWTQISSPEQLAEIRHAAMETFLTDFPVGKAAGRYLDAQLPNLPFADYSFDLALCSHLLFLYTDQLTFELHLQAICELCRVASEVRIFPLVDLTGRESAHLQPMLRALGEIGFTAKIAPVAYAFQRGGDRMLVVRSGD